MVAGTKRLAEIGRRPAARSVSRYHQPPVINAGNAATSSARTATAAASGGPGNVGVTKTTVAMPTRPSVTSVTSMLTYKRTCPLSHRWMNWLTYTIRRMECRSVTTLQAGWQPC